MIINVKTIKGNKKNHVSKAKENRRKLRKEKLTGKIDPNSPFAALLALKETT